MVVLASLDSSSSSADRNPNISSATLSTRLSMYVALPDHDQCLSLMPPRTYRFGGPSVIQELSNGSLGVPGLVV